MILSFNIFVIEITDAAMSLTSIKKKTKRVPEKENGINKNSKKEKSFVVMLLN